MQNWEKGTPLSRIIGKEDRDDALRPFIEKAERYAEQAEKILAAETLATLTRGFLTGCGGIRGVTEEKCQEFVRDHHEIVWRVMDSIPDDDRAAAIYALTSRVAQGKE